MELEQMRQIDAIARTGTMSAAADELHISQPALSRSIQRLEAELGCALFDRVGRRVELNEIGRVAVDWARELLRDERLMREEIATVVQRARALRVASVAPAPLWRLTGLMVERFPSETLTSELVDERAVMRGIAYVNGTEESAAANSSKVTPVQSLPSKKSHLSVPKNPSARALSGLLALRDIERTTCPSSHADAQSPVMQAEPPSVCSTRGLPSVGPTSSTRSESMPTMSSLSGCLDSLQHTGHPSKQSIAGER